MYRTFNMGMGYAYIVSANKSGDIIREVPGAKVVGEVTEQSGVRLHGTEIH